MKKRGYLVLIIILLGWLCLRWTARVDIPVAVSPEISSAPKKQDSPSMGASVSPVVQNSEPKKRSIVNEMRDIVEKSNQPVVFYGKVIDQDEMPLPGVTVKLSLKRVQEVVPGAIEDKIGYIDVITGSDGLFSLLNQKGSLLSVYSLVKDGYKSPRYGGHGYWYNELVEGKRYVPNAGLPEVFKMYKVSGAEKLLVRRFPQTSVGPEVPEGGVSIYFDVLNGKRVSDGGDLRIFVSRTQWISEGLPRCQWSAVVESLSGGIIRSDDELMYQAPKTGYDSKMVIEFPKPGLETTVYFFLRIGDKYSRVNATFSFPANPIKGEIFMKAYINPTGSRNLEYDSGLEIK